ncbi:MAG: MMPL family transporter [Lachnospiraceae bacterium]|nr:MMPL family transporter [Lachnospiraceae bacterium]
MKNLGKAVVKLRIPILILSIILLIPAGIGYLNTRINYDILSYLPKDIETMQGQDILLDEFGTGAFSVCAVRGMENKEITTLENEIKEIDVVKDVIWYGSIADTSMPIEIFPDEIKDALVAEDGTQLMIITYSSSMSTDETLEAVEKIRTLTDKQCLLSGMSAVVEDIKLLCNKEAIIYVIIAVILCAVVLSFAMDSFMVQALFLLSIGMSILYNMGTNFVSGEISFITQALAAVLQLAVTMDYSIFLWHSYQENIEKVGDKKEAMAEAINQTLVSVIGSSITTVAGFLAMCFMTFTLGVDLGIVMAKGVVFGVIGCVTILPSMILLFDKAIEKTRHRALLPDVGRIGGFVTKFYPVFLIIFLVLIGPAYYGQAHNKVYYDLVATLPDRLESVLASEVLDESFNQGATHVVLADSNMDTSDAYQMEKEIENVDGVKACLGLTSVAGPLVPKEALPEKLVNALDSGKYQMIYVMSEYKTGSDEVNSQCDAIKAIVKKYDESAMLIGEAPCTEDLIDITDIDFKTVSIASIVMIFIIIAIVLKSISLPFILVFLIEFGIFVNMGIPYYTGTVLPFIASIVIGTIQLGATVDYAILMTNRYKRERYEGNEKKEAIKTAVVTSLQSVLVSALSFFAATFGVGLYSSNAMISALCILLARGAMISLLCVAFLLPAFFMVFDPIIVRTSIGFLPKDKKQNNTKSKRHSSGGMTNEVVGVKG